ncbi:sensor histidine kinase [Rhodoferax aquaticus]|uniref:histidine kinase n=1 Tax=Rhodoferax aquaticus TaxID=2527691 RepID=A0A515ERR1_9BURK|nr:ATP-binding protein [Rhodoferax aquaticus]QDL55352.1 HAMP domain-containing protein [Rhodoferax aquaticus]
MKIWWRPTLVKRVMLGLFLVFFLVWDALIAYSYWRNFHDIDAKSRTFGRYVAESLASVQDPDQARALVKGLADIQNKIFDEEQVPLALLIQLWDKDGRLVYAHASLEHAQLTGHVDHLTEETAGGRPVYVARTELPQWTLVVAHPRLELGWALRAIALDLLPYMVIAFTLISLVMWIAVRRGLRPLQLMSAHIAARSPNDLAPTGIDTRYAELQPLQQALDSMLDKLRHKVERETAFVQEAAHELRTPMAVVSAQAHVLRMAQDPETRSEAEDHLDAALARASHLVGQLLQLAHVGGERVTTLAPLDLAQDVRSELAALVPSAMQRNIELGLDAPDRLVVTTERQTFKSILHNLVGNAIRYVQQGGKVDVSLVHNGRQVVLSVSDNGPGIPAEQRELVFERFHRGLDHAAPGAGLGLAIVRQACKRLGGHVVLLPGAHGVGCQFLVTLDIAQH